MTLHAGLMLHGEPRLPTAAERESSRGGNRPDRPPCVAEDGGGLLHLDGVVWC